MILVLLNPGMSFFLPNDPDDEPAKARLGSIAAAIFTFIAVHSPGEGSVPFAYNAEACPFYIRDIGMSFATTIYWGYNFILSLT
jgi:hypothetical protein